MRGAVSVLLLGCLTLPQTLPLVSLVDFHFLDGEIEAQGSDSSSVTEPGLQLSSLSKEP